MDSYILNTPLRFKTKVITVVFIFGLVFGFKYYAFGEIFDFRAHSCKSNDDCVIKWCCPAECRNKIDESKPCHGLPECEVSYWPPDQICGCVNNVCQGSNELFVRYNSLKDQAMNMSLSDPQAAMGLCDSMHGEYIFECYAKLALNILPVNVPEAIKVCDRVAEKYSGRMPVDYECYSTLSREIAKNDPDLAINVCAKAPIKSRGDSISYRASCARDIAAIFAKTDLIKAFKACDINKGEYSDCDFCKKMAIKIVEQEYINDPEKAKKVLVEPNICEAAGFHHIRRGSMGAFHRHECYITSARVLARNKNTEEAIRYCNQFFETDLYEKNACFHEISQIVAQYDASAAASICNKILPEKSGYYTPEKCKMELSK